jgi:hypothetical protein
LKTCIVGDCDKRAIGFGYCSKHYTRVRRYGDPFFPGLKGGRRSKKIDFKEKNGCFIITSHELNKDGYSEIMIRGRTLKIHRHIYEQCFGEIPRGLVIRHKCDNPSCINPEHLETGTLQENIADMISRNRQAKGSKKPFSKLRECDVIEIKKMLLDGMTNRSIAKKYQVDESIISEIKNNKAWKHVQLKGGLKHA